MQLANLADTDTELETTDHLTKDMLIGTLPDKRFRKYVTDDIVKVVNSEADSELRRVFRDNVLSYSSVLSTGKHSLAAYVNAVKFVSLRLLGDKSSTAYSKVFPDRYQNLVDRGSTASQIASFSDNYGKTGLITKIMEQTMVPTHILNAGIYQEAINVQAQLMTGAKSEMVRQKAAESLMTALKARALAQQQMKLILGKGITAKEAAHSDIIAKKTQPVETEYTDITDEAD